MTSRGVILKKILIICLLLGQLLAIGCGQFDTVTTESTEFTTGETLSVQSIIKEDTVMNPYTI